MSLAPGGRTRQEIAAATRPCPATMPPAASISTGLVQPSLVKLSAICRICFAEWVRGLPK